MLRFVILTFVILTFIILTRQDKGYLTRNILHFTKTNKIRENITKETTRQCKFYLQLDFYNNVQMNYFCTLMFKCLNVLFEFLMFSKIKLRPNSQKNTFNVQHKIGCEKLVMICSSIQH